MRSIVRDRLWDASENPHRQHQAGSDRFSLPRRSSHGELAVAMGATCERLFPWIEDLLQTRDAAQYRVIKKTFLR